MSVARIQVAPSHIDSPSRQCRGKWGKGIKHGKRKKEGKKRKKQLDRHEIREGRYKTKVQPQDTELKEGEETTEDEMVGWHH